MRVEGSHEPTQQRLYLENSKSHRLSNGETRGKIMFPYKQRHPSEEIADHNINERDTNYHHAPRRHCMFFFARSFS